VTLAGTAKAALNRIVKNVTWVFSSIGAAVAGWFRNFFLREDQRIERHLETAADAYQKGDIAAAEEAVNEILKLRPDDLMAINQKGHIHKLRGELDMAEHAYGRVVELAEQQNDEEARAIALGNLGLIYRTRGELGRAEEAHTKALEIDERLGRLEGVASAYGNLGLIAKERGDTKKARELWTRARDLFKKIGMPHMVKKVQVWLDELADADQAGDAPPHEDDQPTG